MKTNMIAQFCFVFIGPGIIYKIGPKNHGYYFQNIYAGKFYFATNMHQFVLISSKNNMCIKLEMVVLLSFKYSIIHINSIVFTMH